MANTDWRLGLRTAPREKIFEPASLSVGAGSAHVHMLDVSTGGAKLHCPTPLAIGASVVLTWADQERIANVAWIAGPRCGVRFRIPLAVDQIETLTRPVMTIAPHDRRKADGRPTKFLMMTTATRPYPARTPPTPAHD